MKQRYFFKRSGGNFLIFAPGYAIDLSLMAYAKALKHGLAENSLKAYLIEVTKWLNFLDRNDSRSKLWDLHPEELRGKIYQFLTQEYNCQLNFARFHEDAFLVKERGVKNGRAKMFLCAVAHFYKAMYFLKFYSFKNPLKIPIEKPHNDASLSDERIRMPLISGCESPASSQVLPYRLSNNYFVCVGNDWIPKTLDNPEFPVLMLEGGKKIKWSLREIVIFRLLFETGARISEVLGLTLADWVKFGCKDTAIIFSKGSGGIRVKKINWSADTTKLLRHYFNTQRKNTDIQGFTLSEYLGKHDETLFAKTPLFINKYCREVLANSFRSLYWNLAAKAAGIKANPHQARHWYVTSYMRTIFAEAGSSDLEHPDVAQAIQGLISYMKWKDGESMIKTYNHFLLREKVINYQSKIHEGFGKSLERNIAPQATTQESLKPSSHLDARLQTLFDLVDSI